ncbi:hypothetical protein ACFLZR_02300 [Candidatus Neomarinimicrobiota bacterium]
MASRGSNTWLLQRVSGALLFITLGAHFYIYHFFMGPGMWGFTNIGYGANDLETLRLMAELSPEELKFYTLASLFANPLWKVFDVLFIGLASYHGFYGISSIINDWVTNDGLRSLANWLVTIVGVIVCVIGVIAVISFNPGLF